MGEREVKRIDMRLATRWGGGLAGGCAVLLCALLALCVSATNAAAYYKPPIGSKWTGKRAEDDGERASVSLKIYKRDGKRYAKARRK